MADPYSLERFGKNSCRCRQSNVGLWGLQLSSRECAPHSLLAIGKVDPLHPDLAVDPLSILRPPGKLAHQLPLVSAYSSFARMVWSCIGAAAEENGPHNK